MKQLWLLVGSNGAGKSTFYETHLKPLGLPFINADQIAKQVFPDAPESHSYDAAKIAENMRMDALSSGTSFCFETVFSHHSKIDFVAHAKALGYEIIMVVIHLESAELNKARISQRVAAGGHFVPDEKVEQRIPRTLANIKQVLPLCDQVRVLDNSLATNPFQQLFTIRQGVVDMQTEQLPAWAEALIQSC